VVLAFVGSFLWLPRLAAGQDVAGVVRDAQTQAPLPGAVVMLLGADRQAVARALTSRSGHFRLRRDPSELLRVIRIGYAPQELPIAEIGDRAITVDLVPLGNRLPPVTVSASPVCPRRADQREALALWTAVTEALSALVVASEADAATDTVIQLVYSRLLDRDDGRIVRQSWRRVVTGNVAPIRAERSATEFARSGYVTSSEGRTTYFGPDPQVLLDPRFADTHCLSLRSDERRHPGEVGVAFAPVIGRDSVPDIAGVLWLTRRPLTLRAIEFEYRGVDPIIRDARAGGRLELETLENGVPIIRTWHIRSPRIRYFAAGGVSRGRAFVDDSVATIAELREDGGWIVSGTLADGTRFKANLATVRGRVLDETGRGVPHALVALDSTDAATSTNSGGEFALDAILPGPYTLRVRDSLFVPKLTVGADGALVPDTALHQVFTRAAMLQVNAAASGPTFAELRLPPQTAIRACESPPNGHLPVTVYGEVITTDSIPLPNAGVRMLWADSRSQSSELLIRTRTDDRGRFVVCGLPTDARISVHVETSANEFYEGTMTVPARLPDADPGTGALRRITLTVARLGR
jgi:hypothetical protein